MKNCYTGFLVAALASLPLVAAAQAPKPASGSLTIAFAAEAAMLDPVRSAAGVDQYFIGQMFEQFVMLPLIRRKVLSRAFVAV
jgi:hypothetical protein